MRGRSPEELDYFLAFKSGIKIEKRKMQWRDVFATEYFLEANAKYNAGDYEGAVEYYQHAIQESLGAVMFYPSDTPGGNDQPDTLARVHHYLALAYKELKNYPKTIEHLNYAVELGYQYAEAYADRGDVYAEMRDYGRARRDYLAAIAIDPDCKQAQYGLKEMAPPVSPGILRLRSGLFSLSGRRSANGSPGPSPLSSSSSFSLSSSDSSDEFNPRSSCTHQ